ncbi:hypothetical protein [Bacillus sp. T3]|uniref:hypothetical protein n=1 Tax=Bacillus sp. T3 TaxID=467262 RepID=UPI002981D764|nr:hypothetical protein [Bacillus sp. T3]
MKGYVVILLQLMIWSGYSVIEWLSKHDQPLYNGLMFLIFIYIAFLVGNSLLKSAKKTLLMTVFSLLIYLSVQLSLSFIQAKF